MSFMWIHNYHTHLFPRRLIVANPGAFGLAPGLSAPKHTELCYSFKQMATLMEEI
jgi:hypothetical protein